MTDYLSPPLTTERKATIALQQAAAATAVLARFVAEGPGANGGFEEESTCERLAEALKLALEVEQEVHHDDDRNQLLGALSRFIEGWA